MPRKPRLYLPDIPCHVITRGNNRSACFFADSDYHFYLQCLGKACKQHSVLLHAYVLMTNHVHLLMTPANREGISDVMQSVGRRYVQYINKTWKRSGTLWESRHRATPVDAEGYMLACYRYIELNPVRADMVVRPEDYPWSSFKANARGAKDELLTPHGCYQNLGTTPAERQFNYQSMFGGALNLKTINEIRNATNFSIPLGDRQFRARFESSTVKKGGGLIVQS